MNFWTTLNTRERTLAKLTGGLIGIAILVGIFYRGYDRFTSLDNRIDSLEQEVLNLHHYKAQQEDVETAYRKVVEEHSTKLTMEEIHDGLRREIYRLALRNPDVPYNPQKSIHHNDYMVKIPTLREGILKVEGDGYREYQVRFTIPSCNPLEMLVMTRRLETSGMLLRIDSFDMAREPSGTQLRLTYEVTRTVLDNPESDDFFTSADETSSAEYGQ
ncbi:MAG: hypothetical protein COA73_06410 [Candidatus Hydrogenedentota bacterium]|nr:MAG: hypothetical protein COA73_06410 [Candidatus Hydrogenedentota bacterium]